MWFDFKLFVQNIKPFDLKACLLGPALAPLVGGKYNLYFPRKALSLTFSFLVRCSGLLLFLEGHAGILGICWISDILYDLFLVSRDKPVWISGYR